MDTDNNKTAIKPKLIMKSLNPEEAASADENKNPIVLSDKDKIKIFNEWKRFLDEIAPKILPSENVVYSCLFWLSIGRKKKECDASYAEIKKLTNIKADMTVGKNIEQLQKMRFLDIVHRGFHVKSRYRVYSPLEILTPDKNDNEEVKRIQKQGAKKNGKKESK